MTTRITVPSIAGYETKLFDRFFWNDIKKDPCFPVPMIGEVGSLGIPCVVTEDASLLLQKSKCSTAQEFIKFLATQLKKNKSTPHETKKLAEFLFWAQSNQRFFFLRKGHKILGLCEKIGTYVYEAPATDDMFWRHSHRIQFKFLRYADPKEQEELNKSLPVIQKVGEAPRPAGMACRTIMFSNTLDIPCKRKWKVRTSS